MRYQVLLLTVILFLIAGCSEDEAEEMNMTNDAVVSLFIGGFPAFTFDDISGEIDTDYEVTNTLHAAFDAMQSSGNTSLSIQLDDDDDSLFPFNGIIPFSVTGTDIKATIRLTEDGATSTATSGSVGVSAFSRVNVNNWDYLRISGNIAATIDGTTITGIFSDVLLYCGECE